MRDKKNQKGVLSLDFMFSILAMYSIGMVFALLCMTLTLAEVSQYILFSVNRAHISAHIGPEDQILMGIRKRNSLVGRFGSLISSGTQGWTRLQISDGPLPDEAFEGGSGASRQSKYGFVGTFTSNILQKMTLPLLGSPSDGADEDQFGKGQLRSILYREPTTTECLNFNTSRWKAILALYPDLRALADDSTPHGAEADNGC